MRKINTIYRFSKSHDPKQKKNNQRKLITLKQIKSTSFRFISKQTKFYLYNMRFVMFPEALRICIYKYHIL